MHPYEALFGELKYRVSVHTREKDLAATY